jgi:hypothetical protein
LLVFWQAKIKKLVAPQYSKIQAFCLNKKNDARDQYNNGNKIITMDCSESQSFHQVLHNLDAFHPISAFTGQTRSRLMLPVESGITTIIKQQLITKKQRTQDNTPNVAVWGR